MPLGADQEVLGLQVTMHDPLLVRGGESVRDLERVLDRLPRRDRSAGEPLAQRLALEQLLNDEGDPVVLADVVQRDDVGMIQGGGRAGFLFEPPQPIRIRRK